MQVRPILTLILATSLTSSVVLAQPTTTAPVPRPVGKSLATGRNPAGQHLLYYDALKTAVGLDEVQQKKVQELLSAADEEFRVARTDMLPPPEVRARMGETIKEIEAARKAGDAEKEKTLIQERTQIVRSFTDKRQKMIERMKASDESLHKSIGKVLRSDQLEKFEAFWPDRNVGLDRPERDPYEGMVRSPIALKAATDRLGDLTADQKTNIELAFKAYQDASRAGTQPNESAQVRALKKLYSDVFVVFTDGQRQRVVQELSPKKDGQPNEATSAPAEHGADAKPVPAPAAP